MGTEAPHTTRTSDRDLAKIASKTLGVVVLMVRCALD